MTSTKGEGGESVVSAKIDEAASAVSDQAAQMKHGMEEIGGRLDSAVRKSLREQPIGTLLAVTAVGFVIGALWKS